MVEKKSSEEWSREIEPFCEILDPDGWDRRPENFNTSWRKPITKQEFMERLCKSTIHADIQRLIFWEKQ